MGLTAVATAGRTVGTTAATGGTTVATVAADRRDGYSVPDAGTLKCA